MHCHQPTQLKATSPSHHSLPGRTALRSNSFFSPNFAPPVPLLLAYRKRLSPKARLATQPGAEPPSSLTARVGKGQVTPPVHTPLLPGVTHTWSTGLAHQHRVSKGRHCPGISPGQHKRELPPRRSLASPPGRNQCGWRTVIFTQLLLRVHTRLEKNQKIFPRSLFENNNTPGFYNPPGQHLICSPSPCGKL